MLSFLRDTIANQFKSQPVVDDSSNKSDSSAEYSNTNNTTTSTGSSTSNTNISNSKTISGSKTSIIRVTNASPIVKQSEYSGESLDNSAKLAGNKKRGWPKPTFQRKGSLKTKHKPATEEELNDLTTKYPYCRPSFLDLSTTDELQVALKHNDRIITLPKRLCLPKYAGYAECTNAGKSVYNEDQAAAIELKLGLVNPGQCSTPSSNVDILDNLTIYAVFDGHAGSDVAVTVSHELPHRIKERISDVIVDLKLSLEANIQEDTTPQTISSFVATPLRKKITVDRLVIGAIEAAFHDMDNNLIEDEAQYCVKGGCAANIALFYAGKLYVANAGDCRAVISLNGKVIPMSTDFTPEVERRRLQQIAEQHPDLLGNEFCSRQFVQRVTRKDVGTELLYRDSRMEGWAYKSVTEEDLRFPLIIGEGKRARLLATIGLTRGLGDHNLKVFDSNIMIKPFLSPSPEVKIFDFSSAPSLSPDDVVIMGSDGLWDVVTNEDAVHIVGSVLSQLPVSDSSRYIAAAQALVSKARGKQRSDRPDIWVLGSVQEFASHDDITCFVIPLFEFRKKDQESVDSNLHKTATPLSDRVGASEQLEITSSTVNTHSDCDSGKTDNSSIENNTLDGQDGATPNIDEDQIKDQEDDISDESAHKGFLPANYDSESQFTKLKSDVERSANDEYVNSMISDTTSTVDSLDLNQEIVIINKSDVESCDIVSENGPEQNDGDQWSKL